jgi:hypothetical protein
MFASTANRANRPSRAEQSAPLDLLDEFIAEQLSETAKDRIRTWGR